MEFIKTSKYLSGKFNRQIDFEELKTLEKIKVNQKLELLSGKDNLSLLKKYAASGLKVVPIRRFSDKDWSWRKNFPNRILLEITSRCNYHCRMCPRHNLKRPKINMAKELCFKVLDELDKYGAEGVWLYHLGESILHPDWKEIVSYAGKKDNIGMLWFSTNGYAFNKDCADFILDSRITFLNYSLHGTNAQTYGYVSPAENYPKVRKNLEYLLARKKALRRGLILHIQMIEQAGTRDNINEFLETFYETGEIVSINMLEYANLPNNRYGLKRQRPPVVKKCNRITRGDCFIVSNGDVQPCDATYNSEILLGNVKKGTVYDIWNSLTRKKILALNQKNQMYKIPHCKKCTDYDL